MKTLTECVEACGYRLILCKRPGSHKDRIGGPVRGSQRARILSGRRIATISKDWDNAYSVSHEICEHYWNFKHSIDMFSMQADLLATWHAMRSGHVKNPVVIEVIRNSQIKVLK